MSWIKKIVDIFSFKYRYFIVVQNELNNDKLLDENIVKFVKRFFFWKLSKIEYYELFSISKIENYVVFGNCENDGKSINKNAFIFLLELSNELKHGIKVSNDFPLTIKRDSKFTYKIYKVKMYKPTK